MKADVFPNLVFLLEFNECFPTLFNLIFWDGFFIAFGANLFSKSSILFLKIHHNLAFDKLRWFLVIMVRIAFVAFAFHN
jgi:hypothetical protein